MASKVTPRWLVAGLVGVAAFGAGVAGEARAAAPVVQDAKAELEKKLAAIDRKDANAVFGIALWAEQNNLKTDSKRLLREVIKINPDHAEARALLGYEKFGDKWLTKREIEREKAKAEEAEMAAKGLKKWKDQWVPADDYAKLEKGLVKYEADGEAKWVTPEQKERLEKGMELYEGTWVTKEEIEHRRKGEFKIGEKWVNEAEADKFHSDFTNPWELESDYFALKTSCTYSFGKKALMHADKTFERAYQLLGLPLPKSGDLEKISLVMVKDAADYQQLGNLAQDAIDATMSSNWSAFILSDQNTGRLGGVAIYEVAQAGNDEGNDNLSLTHLRFAAGAATVRNLTFAEPPPPWFAFGVASCCSRYWVPLANARDQKVWQKWTLDTVMREGGTSDLKTIFDNFEPTKPALLTMGAVISFLSEAPNRPKKVEEQWTKILEGLKKPKEKGLLKDFLKLEAMLGKDGAKEFDAYLASIQG
jgi:hypothetical protein